MKKTKLLLTVFALIFVLSGCVKYNGSMDIKKDKSMQFDTIYAVNESLLEGETFPSEEQRKKIKERGYTITDYSQDKMKGVTLSKSIKNIDDVSSEKNVVFNLSSMFEEEEEQSNFIFKVEKGFLKNTYTAEFILDSDSGLGDETTTEESTGDESLDDDNFSNYLNMMSDLEMTFVVKLPYAAISSNATSKSSDNKTLTWNLLDDSDNENKNENEDEIVIDDEITTDGESEEEKTVQFKFEIYNLTNIYICAGVIAFLIVVVVISSISKNKKPKPIIPPQYTEPVPKLQPFQESVMNVRQPESIQGTEINANQSISNFVNQSNGMQNSNVVLNSVVPQSLINDQSTTISNQPTVDMSNIDVPPMEPVGFESPQMPTMNNNVEEPPLETLSFGNEFNDLNQQSNQNNTFPQ